MGSSPAEADIIDDILFVLAGADGHYIHIIYSEPPSPDAMAGLEPPSYLQNNSQITFAIDDTIDNPTAEIISQILPTAARYLRLDAFVKQFTCFEFGVVNHALSAAIRELLKEYLRLVAQLEHQLRLHPDTFTLQQLVFHISPTMHTFARLDDLISVILSASEHSGVGRSGHHHGGGPRFLKNASIGGQTLDILANQVTQRGGDPTARRLYAYLLSQASAPYFRILDRWIHRGEIDDEYSEFMIAEAPHPHDGHASSKTLDSMYWDERYAIQAANTPTFLLPMAEKILSAGKYLNVVRECGGLLQTRAEDGSQPKEYAGPSNDVMDAVNRHMPTHTIERAYIVANEALLNLLLKENHLSDHLRAMKHYFFLDQSDWMTHFLDIARDELRRPYREISPTKLQSLLDIALRNPASVHAEDGAKENIHVCMSPQALLTQLVEMEVPRAKKDRSVASPGLGIKIDGEKPAERPQSATSSRPNPEQWAGGDVLTGVEAMMLDYHVHFPISLILTRHNVFKYQMIFRHVVQLKYIEYLLCQSWMRIGKSSATATKAGTSRGSGASPAEGSVVDEGEGWGQREVQKWFSRAYALRNRMLLCIQQILDFVCLEVLEPSWVALEQQLAKARTADELSHAHARFLDQCLTSCMLSNPKLMKILTKLKAKVTQFAHFVSTVSLASSSLPTADRASVAPPSAADTTATPQWMSQQPVAADANREKQLARFEHSFHHDLKLFLDALVFYAASDIAKLTCLVVRLDFNHFYSQR